MRMLESRENPTPNRMASCGCHEKPVFAWVPGVKAKISTGPGCIHKIHDRDWLAYKASGTVESEPAGRPGGCCESGGQRAVRSAWEGGTRDSKGATRGSNKLQRCIGAKANRVTGFRGLASPRHLCPRTIVDPPHTCDKEHGSCSNLRPRGTCKGTSRLNLNRKFVQFSHIYQWMRAAAGI